MRRWCRRYGVEVGSIVPVDVVHRLGALWYEGRLERDFEPKPAADKEAIFRQLGLPLPFWTLAS